MNIYPSKIYPPKSNFISYIFSRRSSTGLFLFYVSYLNFRNSIFFFEKLCGQGTRIMRKGQSEPAHRAKKPVAFPSVHVCFQFFWKWHFHWWLSQGLVCMLLFCCIGMYVVAKIDSVEGRYFALWSTGNFLVLLQTVVDCHFGSMTKFEDMRRELVAVYVDESFAAFVSLVFGDWWL